MVYKKYIPSLSRSMIILAAGAVLITGVAAGCNSTVQTDTTTPQSTSPTSTSDSSNDAMMAMTDSKAANLRVGLDELFTQHVDLALSATRAGYDGSKSFTENANALDRNSVAISQAIGSVYGNDAATQFLAIWRSHIGFIVDYTCCYKKR